MRFALMLEGQEGVTWPRWLRVARTAERLGFEALFTSDHYFSVQGAPGRGSNDAWTILAGLAASTERIRLGTMVSPVTFRHPTVLAKIATTVDHISGGRVEIGIGAGWWQEEHRTHGFPFPPTAERFEIFEEQVEIVHGLLTQDSYSFESPHYAIEGCEFLHRPVQRPHPPIVLGGRKAGPRMQRLVARFADEFNTVGGTPEEVRERFGRIRGGLETADRDPSSVTMSMMTWVFVGIDEDEWRDRVERARRNDPSAGSAQEYLDDLSRDCIVGTPDRAIQRLREYADAGVQRMVLNHELVDDDEMLELLATQVMPALADV
ncbi:MAG TPA: TIGR03560 family F420-dependent LLM class oxidoreductase [Actinomycetota bacterium]|nr:TIGR03560 family F420-dependent LLM class oxidoreductase [Actinomycetota bacterium]